MIHFIDKTLENLRPYVPLFQTLIWPTLIACALWCFRKPVTAVFETIRKRIEKGSSLKAGPVEIGEDLQKLDYAGPAAKQTTESTEPADWVSERTAVYRDNSGLFLTHILIPSKNSDQDYDIYIYLIRHKTQDMSDIAQAEFFLGHMWNNKVFKEKPDGSLLGISTTAYAPFLCTCRVQMRDGKLIKLHRYIDFEMGKRAAAQQGVAPYVAQGAPSGER